MCWTSSRLRVKSLLAICWLLPLHNLSAHEGIASTLGWLDQQIEQAPELQGLWVRRGALLVDDGHLDAAQADLEHARALGEPVRVDCEWGHLQYQRGQFNIAAEALDRYLEQFPDDTRCRRLRAQANVARRHNAAALVDLRYLVEIDTAPNPGLFLQTADSVLAVDASAIEPALAILDDGISRLGVTPALQQRAIALETERHHLDAAIRRLKTLEQVEHRSPRWRLQMAELQWRYGHIEEARTLLISAERDINQLKPTPARRALQQRIAETSRQIAAADG